MAATPAPSSAANTAATLELANNRSEAVYVAVQNWDANRNTNYMKGWFLVKPNASTRVTIENYGDWEQVLWLYAVSQNNVWQGDPNANLSDPDLSALVNTSINFQYWGHGEQYVNQQDWKTVYLFSIKENGAHGNFICSFE
ncbi:MAG TPA: hypothetical protein VN611_00065, partial [Patescibacteria group bacterium]|nr:hypothetical protein [Patescibacteria group bacterium]